MLKKRIVPVLLLAGERLVKTVAFDKGRDVGDPVKSAAVYNSQLADELMLLNVDRVSRTIEKLPPLLDKIAAECFMPLTVGGGVRTFADAQILFTHGADKIVINSAAYGGLALLQQIAGRYGSQAVVVGMDARYSKSTREHVLYSNCGSVRQEISLVDHVERCIKSGAGEIFIQSIDRDGAMEGFDLELIKSVMTTSSVPVIACGGAGNYEHLRSAFTQTGVDALACGSLFNFSDSNPLRAKAFLSNHGIAFKVV